MTAPLRSKLTPAPEGEGTNERLGVEALLRDCLRGIDRAAGDVRRLRVRLIGGE